MRYRRGKLSLGESVAKILISELLKKSHKSNWRIGNDINKCNLCGKCELICPVNALIVDKISKTWTLNNYNCNKCLKCIVTCPKRCLNQVQL